MAKLMLIQHRFSSSQLRGWVLEVANLMIDAARLETREDVVLMQSIMVFKMTLTLAKFEEVHTLCPAKDWPTVKKGDPEHSNQRGPTHSAQFLTVCVSNCLWLYVSVFKIFWTILFNTTPPFLGARSR